MAKKRVLIVTYYWPPSGGGGVQRWLKFAKLLPEWGWEPVIVTPSNPDVPVTDASLNDEIQPNTLVWSYPVHEPTRWLRAIGLGGASSSRLGAGGHKGVTWFTKCVHWFRGNLFVPDARIGWVRPTARKVLRDLKEHPVDLIVSTQPATACTFWGSGSNRLRGCLGWLTSVILGQPWITSMSSI